MKGRQALALAIVVLATAGCGRLLKKKKAVDDPPPTATATTSAVASASAAPKAAPPPFVAPAALPPDDVFLLGDRTGATLRIDVQGAFKRDDKNAILDVTRGKDGAVYGTTTQELRKLTGGTWKVARKYGTKTSVALIMAEWANVRVVGGPRGLRVAVLTNKEQWTGPIDDTIMAGRELAALYNPAIDGAALLWGTSIDDKLVMEKIGTDFEKVAWAPSKTVRVVPRAGAGVFALAADRVAIGAAGNDSVSAALPVTVDGKTKAAVSENDVLVLKVSADTLLFVSPSGGVSTVKASVGDTFAVDGRSRVWSLEGDTLRVLGPDGAVVATKKVPATMKPEAVRRIVALGGGANLK